MESGNNLEITPGVAFELPVYAKSDMDVGAISLILDFPADQLTINSIYLGSNPDEPAMFNLMGNELRIGWHSLEAYRASAGEPLLTLNLTFRDKTVPETGVRISMAGNPQNELADGNYNVIYGAVLVMPVLTPAPTDIDDNPDAIFTLAAHPNPFVETTRVTYNLPKAGKVTLKVLDVLGQQVFVPVCETQSAGYHEVLIGSSLMRPGVYTATLTLDTGKRVITKTIKIVRQQ
jgi:hypothetical protein